MNATGGNDTCLWYQTTGKSIVFFMAYYVVTPIHFIFGITGHLLCLIAYRHRAKKQKAYVYQIFVTISEASEIATYSLSIAISAWWSGRLGPGKNWFMSTYILMWFSGHMISPIVNIFITACPLFALAMAFDRVYAVAQPLKYKNSDHTRGQIVSCVFCMGISILTSLVDILRFNVVPNGNGPGLYKLETNAPFTDGLLASVLAQIRNIIRGGSTLALVGCNVVLVYSYRKRIRKVGIMMNKNMKEMHQKKDERMLTILSIFQCSSTALAMTAMISNSFVTYLTPNLFLCAGSFIGAATDIVNELTSVADFYILVALSTSFRGIVLDGVRAIGEGAVSIINANQWALAQAPAAPAAPMRPVGGGQRGPSGPVEVEC